MCAVSRFLPSPFKTLIHPFKRFVESRTYTHTHTLLVCVACYRSTCHDLFSTAKGENIVSLSRRFGCLGKSPLYTSYSLFLFFTFTAIVCLSWQLFSSTITSSSFLRPRSGKKAKIIYPKGKKNPEISKLKKTLQETFAPPIFSTSSSSSLYT